MKVTLFLIAAAGFCSSVNGQWGVRSGGFSSIPADELLKGAKVHRLAAFALDALLTKTCAASNALACSRLLGAEMVSVISARKQVVSGLNYEIEAETTNGKLVMRVYEQSWTNTLTLMEASFSPANSMLTEALPLLTEAEPLDAAAFSSSKGCTGGQEWNECGSPCTKTCAQPAPMCAMMCQQRCQCPHAKPVRKDGRCIARAQCPAAVSPSSNGCVKNVRPICTRDYRPVCADSITYSNRCLANANCPTTVVDGACPPVSSTRPSPAGAVGDLMGSILLGGVPMGEASVRGGHYTGQDQTTLGGQAPAEPTASKDPAASVPAASCPGCVVESPSDRDSKAHKLAAFALRTLLRTCASSNALGCAQLQGSALVRVLSASTQVVAGAIYEVKAETTAGILKLRLFEQSWTNTLTLSAASLSPTNMAMQMDLLTEEAALDAAAFEAFDPYVPGMPASLLPAGGSTATSPHPATVSSEDREEESEVCAGCPVQQTPEDFA